MNVAGWNKRSVVIMSVVVIVSALVSLAGLVVVRHFAVVANDNTIASLDTVLQRVEQSVRHEFPDYENTSQDDTNRMSMIAESGHSDIPALVLQSQKGVTFQARSGQTQTIDSRVLIEKITRVLESDGLSYKPVTISGQTTYLFGGAAFKCQLNIANESTVTAARYWFGCSDAQAVDGQYSHIKDVLSTASESVLKSVNDQGVSLVSISQVDRSSASGALLLVSLARPEEKWQARSLLFGKAGSTWSYIDDITRVSGNNFTPQTMARITDPRWDGSVWTLVESRVK